MCKQSRFNSPPPPQSGRELGRELWELLAAIQVSLEASGVKEKSKRGTPPHCSVGQARRPLGSKPHGIRKGIANHWTKITQKLKEGSNRRNSGSWRTRQTTRSQERPLSITVQLYVATELRPDEHRGPFWPKKLLIYKGKSWEFAQLTGGLIRKQMTCSTARLTQGCCENGGGLQCAAHMSAGRQRKHRSSL